jgi:hypothetical protein
VGKNMGYSNQRDIWGKSPSPTLAYNAHIKSFFGHLKTIVKTIKVKSISNFKV